MDVAGCAANDSKKDRSIDERKRRREKQDEKRAARTPPKSIGGGKWSKGQTRKILPYGFSMTAVYSTPVCKLN